MIKKISTRLKVINLLADWTITPARFLIPLMLVAALMNGYLMIRNPNMGGDALWFHSSFHNLMAGNGWTNDYGALVEPGYGMLSYPFYLLFGNIELSGMLVSALSYLLMIPTTYFTADFLFGKRSAMLAAWLIAFWPALLSFSYVNLSDTAFAFFALLAFAVYTRIVLERSTLLRSVVLGLTLSMAYLLRESEGLWIAGLALASLFAFALVDLRHSDEKKHIPTAWIKPFQYPSMTAFIFFGAILFYAILIHSQIGVWTVFTRIRPVRVTNQVTPIAGATPIENYAPVESAPEVAPIEKNELIEYVVAGGPDIALYRQNLRVLGAHLIWMNIHAIAPLTLVWALFPFVATKRLFTRLRPDKRSLKLLLALSIFLSPVWPLLFFPDRTALRYYLSDFVYILILVAFLTVRLVERILESLNGRYFDFGLMAVCLVALITALSFGLPNLRETLSARHAHSGLRAAGLWLRDNVSNPDDLSLVASPKSSVLMFYAADQNFVTGNKLSISAQQRDQIGVVMDAEGVDYLVLDNHYVHQMPPLDMLWENPKLAQEYGVSLLYQDFGGLFQIYVSDVVDK